MAREAIEKIKVEFGSVSIGDQAASVPMKFKLDPENPGEHVSQVWSELMKRRLNGTILIGDDMPSQDNFTDRTTIEGSFDTQKPSFDDEYAKLTITFDHSEIEAKTLIEFSHKAGFIQIDNTEAIPPKKKSDGATDLWDAQPVARLGIENTVVQDLFDAGIKKVGDVVLLIKEEHPEHSFKSLAIKKARQDEIRQKTGLFLEDAGQEVDW